MARNELRFGILGPLEISAGFRSLPLGTPKQRAVLATLIIHRNRPVGIDSLIDAAWEQDRPEGSRATVYTYVSNLRRLVSTTGADSHSILASAPPGYRLAVADNQYDVARFISQRSAGLRAAAAGSFEQASDHLSAALAEWRGPVLDDLREFSFVTRLANSLVEDKIIAHTALAEAEIACGRADSVISELGELIPEHPYHEALWRQLIAAYYVSERQSDALDAYRRLKTSLAEDLGVDPGPKVRTLYEQVLRQQALDTRVVVQAAAGDIIRALEHSPGMTDRSPRAAIRDAAGHRSPLGRLPLRIGRSKSNDMVLPDGKVSPYHAVIVNTGESFMITDLRSVNGVYVRGRRITTTATLNDGDHIRIGDHELTFEVIPHESGR